MKIGIVAPSSVLSQVELKLGVERLEKSGFSVRVHPQCGKRHRFFAGKDMERAKAFFDYALDPKIDVIYCARGGYGAARILGDLENLVREHGTPEPKLLVGSSDATCLLEYARNRWGWRTLHAPMPGLRSFAGMKEEEWNALVAWIRRKAPVKPWGAAKLRVLSKVPSEGVSGELVGGNLTVWASILGTPFAGKGFGKILFFEDIGEKLYRLDRVLTQIELAGGLEGARAIILGDYLDCDDSVAQGLAKMPSLKAGFARAQAIQSPAAKDLAPLRPALDATKTIAAMFIEAAERHDIPLVAGLPVGHGPGRFSLPLGAEYELTPKGQLRILRWGWLK